MNNYGLMVGNWIEKNGKQYQISPIGIFCVGKSHKPIPFTEDWLTKFNWIQDGEYWYNDEEKEYRVGFATITQPINGEKKILPYFCVGYDRIENDETKWLMVGNIEYVHRFQNLCTAMEMLNKN